MKQLCWWPTETENFIHFPRLTHWAQVRKLRSHHHEHGEAASTEQRWSGLEMSLRVKSHTDLQTAEKSSLDDGLYKSLSVSSSSINRGARFGNETAGEVKGLFRPCRRPVRAVRPVSTISSNGSFLQINHLQGELVRKRKVRREEGKTEVCCDQVSIITSILLLMSCRKNIVPYFGGRLCKYFNKMFWSVQWAGSDGQQHSCYERNAVNQENNEQ